MGAILKKLADKCVNTSAETLSAQTFANAESNVSGHKQYNIIALFQVATGVTCSFILQSALWFNLIVDILE